MYTKLKSLPIPGFAWFAALVLITGAIHTYAADNAFILNAALLVLAGIAKAVDINYDKVIEVVEEDLDIDIPGSEWITPSAVGHRGSIGPIGPIGPMNSELLQDAEPSRARTALRWLVG
jgi:hypothetical protein